MKKVIFTLALLSPALANADAQGWSGSDRVWHWYPGHGHHDRRPRPVPVCVRSQTFLVGSDTQVVSACEPLRALKLANQEAYFPSLRGGTFHVDYWDGAYAYRTRTVTTYQTVVSNDCSGETLSSDTSYSVSENAREFAVTNPNLDPSIKTSFELSPMLPEEAAAAFAQARMDCQAALARQ